MCPLLVLMIADGKRLITQVVPPALLEFSRGILRSRFAAIVGIGQETVTSVRRLGDDFVYTITRHGDGTVPATSAALPGATTHYAPVAHSDLTRDRVVAAIAIARPTLPPSSKRSRGGFSSTMPRSACARRRPATPGP